MTEEEINLIRLAQRGDVKAFGDLAANYDARVMNLAISLLGSSEDAQDVYQEVFIKVYKCLKGYRFQSDFFTWLYRITVNTCLSYRRSRQRKRALIPSSIEDNPEMADSLPDCEAASLDDGVMAWEMSQLMRRAVDDLPPKQRAVLILRHYQQMKIREIAEILELNEGTVKGYLFRALKALKKKLEPYYRMGEMTNGM